MKKSLPWSILLSLVLVCVMVFGLAPGARAADSDLWIGDTQIDVGENSSGTGWSWDADSRTLTLDSPAITTSHLIGADSTDTANIFAFGLNLTLKGKLTLEGSADYGVFVVANYSGAGGNLTVDGAKLDISGKKAAVSVEGIITVSGASEVVASGKIAGFEVRVKGNVMIEGGSVTATGGGDGIEGGNGIRASGVYLSDGTVLTATGGNHAILAEVSPYEDSSA